MVYHGSTLEAEGGGAVQGLARMPQVHQPVDRLLLAFQSTGPASVFTLSGITPRGISPREPTFRTLVCKANRSEGYGYVVFGYPGTT